MSMQAEITRDAMIGYAAAVYLFYLVATIRAVLRTRATPWRQLVATREVSLASPLSPPVSIIIAVQDEASTVAGRVQSLLALRYPAHEVIVVDARSEDDTVSRLDDAFQLVPATRAVRRSVPSALPRAAYRALREVRLVVLEGSRRDRADALNLGIRAARHPYVLIVSPGATLGQDALLAAVGPLAANDRTDVTILGIPGGIVDDGLEGHAWRPVEALENLEILRSSLLCRAGAGGAVARAFGLVRIGFLCLPRARLEQLGGFDVSAPDPDLDLLLLLDPVGRRQGPNVSTVCVDDSSGFQLDPGGFLGLVRAQAAGRAATLQTLRRQARADGTGRLKCFSTPTGLLSVLLVLAPLVQLFPLAALIAAFLGRSLSVPACIALAALLATPGILILASSLASMPPERERRPRHVRILGLASLAPFLYLGYRQSVATARLVSALTRAAAIVRGRSGSEPPR